MDVRRIAPILYPESPTREQWEGMTAEERARWLASIPIDPPPVEVMAPEGMPHSRPARRSLGALREYFRRRGRPVFLESDLYVFYPGERGFAPDLMAVVDFALPEDVELPAWSVLEQNRGIDLAMEIHVRGDWRKDSVVNVERYARLGIPEYFILDRVRHRLHGYRLSTPTARVYQPILPQGGRYVSEVLGLELGLVKGQLRFFAGTAEIPDPEELIGRLDGLVNELEEKYARQEADLAEEQQRREAAERRLAELEAELERLKRG